MVGVASCSYALGYAAKTRESVGMVVQSKLSMRKPKKNCKRRKLGGGFTLAYKVHMYSLDGDVNNSGLGEKTEGSASF